MFFSVENYLHIRGCDLWSLNVAWLVLSSFVHFLLLLFLVGLPLLLSLTWLSFDVSLHVLDVNVMAAKL